MNDNNRKVQHYAGLVQVSTSIFILGDAMAMSLLEAWGHATGIAYLCAASSLICGAIGLKCSRTPTLRFRQCSHALSFINIGTFYGFGMVMLGTFGFLLDHKRRYPLTLLLAHMAYTLFGLVNICCAMMQAKSVGLKPLFCQNYPRRYDAYEVSAANPPTVENHHDGRFCMCHLSTHPSDLTVQDYPTQLQVMLPVSPDGTVYLDAPLTSVDVIAFDRRPASTPPPPYDEIVANQTVHRTVDPPPAYSDIASHEGHAQETDSDGGEEELEARQPLNPQQHLHNDNNNTNQLRNSCEDSECVVTPLVHNQDNGHYDQESDNNNNNDVINVTVR